MDSHEKAKKDIFDAASLQFIKARDEKPILGVKKKSVRPPKIRLKFKQHDSLPPSTFPDHANLFGTPKPFNQTNVHYSNDPTDIRNLGRHMFEGAYLAGGPATTAYLGTSLLGSAGVPYATKVAENFIKPSIGPLVAAGMAYKARNTTIPAIKKKYEDAWKGHRYQMAPAPTDPGTYVQEEEEGERKGSYDAVEPTYIMNTTKADFEGQTGLSPIGDPPGLRRRRPLRRGGKRARKRTRKKRRKRRTRRKRKRRKRRTRKK